MMPLFSHYGDVPDISDQLALPALGFAIITPLFVIARVVTRLKSMGKLGLDDWAIIGSMVCTFLLQPLNGSKNAVDWVDRRR